MYVTNNNQIPNNTNNNSNNNVNPFNKDAKGIAFIAIGIMTIIAAIAGASYAWFAVSVTDSTSVKGDSAYVDQPLQMDITEKTTNVNTKKLIPQTDAAIQSAVTGTSSKSCIDTNGNAICKVFEIKLTNKSTAQYYVDGTIEFTNSTSNLGTKMPNLKWAKGTSATAGFPSSGTGPFYAPADTHVIKTGTTSNYKTLATDVVLGGTGTGTDVKSFFIVVWISEIGAAQTDQGDFKATVTFTGSNAAGTSTGITSTITS